MAWPQAAGRVADIPSLLGAVGTAGPLHYWKAQEQQVTRWLKGSSVSLGWITYGSSSDV